MWCWSCCAFCRIVIDSGEFSFATGVNIVIVVWIFSLLPFVSRLEVKRGYSASNGINVMVFDGGDGDACLT